MKKLIVNLSVILLFLTIHASSQTAKPKGSLMFDIKGFADNSGQVIVQLFRADDKVPTKPFRHVKAAIINKTALVVVENLPFGDYAAIIVHDKNSNGIIDHRWGVPAEPLGYTNNWELSLFSGMPTFDKLKFTFKNPSDKCNINMKE